MRFSWMTLMAGALAAGAACNDNGPEGTAPVDVAMRQSDAATVQAVQGFLASAAGGMEAIDPDTVASLTVQVTAVEFLPQGSADEESAWVRADLDQAVTVDLAALPGDGESAQVIATGDVPVGTYGNVRLFVEDAEITFKGPITLGVTLELLASVAYDVSIPSAAQTGIKTDATVTVDDDGGQVLLVFRPATTFQNVTATGSGTVILNPVIRGGS